MSPLDFIAGGTFFSILTAIWRGLKLQAREEVAREIVDDRETLDLSDINNLREAIRIELEKGFEKKFDDQKLLYDKLREDFNEQVIRENDTLRVLQDLQREFGVATNAKLSAEYARDKAQAALEDERKAKEKAQADAAAADLRAEESLALAERLQKALSTAELSMQTLNNQVIYLQGENNGLIKGIRNMPVVANTRSLLEEIKIEEKPKDDQSNPGV